MAELSDATHERIRALCAEGDQHARDGQAAEAIEHYMAAWLLLPEPQTDWDAATWILAAIGDAHYLPGEFERGRDALLKAMHCPEAIGNPFLHLRLGQCQFELGNCDRAGDELARAFLLGGWVLFQDGDRRYLEFVKSILDEPPGGWE
jgi:hypothetical protein